MKKVIIRGPALTQSGYGEHCRFLLRSLRKYENVFDLYLIPTGWGKTNWQFEDNEERTWIDGLIKKGIIAQKNNVAFDMSIQVTIPNEWEKVCPVNIGVTAGIETTAVSVNWIQKSQLMDKIIVPSEHSRDSFIKTTYDVQNPQTGEIVKDYRCMTPVTVVPYPVKSLEKSDMDLELETDFNFLVVAQWGPRKNLKNTLRWFVEEFKDENVGLVVKTNFAKNCVLDRRHTANLIRSALNKPQYADRKCKVYLLHGSLKEEEMNTLYTHPKIKALVSLTHGEGYGLPLFEAAYNGLPIIATNWSGHVDFLNVPNKNKKGKNKFSPMFSRVTYELKKIPQKAVWKDILIEDSQWAEPEKGSFRMQLRDVFRDHNKHKSRARKLQKWVLENYEQELIYKKFAEEIYGGPIKTAEDAEYIFVSDFFSDQLVGGAELTLEALLKKEEEKVYKINSSDVTKSFIEKNKDKVWVFGNYTQLPAEAYDSLIESDVKYSVVEFDYKFCAYRNLELHKTLEGAECDCATKEHGANVEKFLAKANTVFFMSQKQLDLHVKHLKSLKKKNCYMLSSAFNDEFFEKVKNLREKYSEQKEDKWVISSSPSWVKGATDAEKWCVDNEKEYVKMHGIDYDQALELLAKSKGLCMLPAGEDTCPRLVIEAKLLGCDLEMNDNVQHKDEKWFDTDNLESIEKYLKNVPNRFWRKVANV